MRNTLLKILVRAVLFIAVFIGTALIVNVISNRGSKDAYVELSGTDLPVVFTCIDDEVLSPVPAYCNAMAPGLLRDAVIPLTGDDRTVKIYMEDRSFHPARMDYQLRDIETDNLIEEGEMTVLDTKDGRFGYEATLRMDIAKGKEYAFVVVAKSGKDEELFFYIRVLRLNKNLKNEFLSAAKDFHDLLIGAKNDLQKKEVNSYQINIWDESDSRRDLGNVTLASEYETLTWGTMKPELSGAIQISIPEIAAESGAVVYRYQVTTTDEEKKSFTTYDVEEYFDMEFVPETAKAKVVDYSRKVERAFVLEDFERDLNGIDLGLSASTPIYLIDDANEYMLFVRNESVWYYDYNASTLSRIFGSERREYIFGVSEGFKLLSVDKRDAYFAVYGRISSGSHEGENGILVEHFNHEDRTIEECCFIRTNLPYAWMNREVGKLLYLDLDQEKLYFFLGETLRSLSLESGEEDILISDLQDDEVLVSSDGAVVAFPEDLDDTPGHDKIHLWDLLKGKRSVIEKQGRKLELLSFVGMDFVYGAAAKDKIRIAADGSTKYYFSNVYFVARDGKEEKDYHKSDILVSEVTFLSNTIYLTRVVNPSGSSAITDTTPDYISYKAEDTKGKTLVKNQYDDVGYQLIFPSYIYMTSVPELIIARMSETPGAESAVSGTVDAGTAYLFRAGELIDRSNRIGTLVREASDQGGNVITLSGSILYRKKTGVPYLTVAEEVDYLKANEGEDGYAACLTMILRHAGVETEQETVKDTLEDPSVAGSWEEAFRKLSGGDVRGLNLSGADLDTAILFLGDGVPFATKLENRYVLVVSFNSDAIRYYDPLAGYEVRTARGDFMRKLRTAGDEYYTYIK